MTYTTWLPLVQSTPTIGAFGVHIYGATEAAVKDLVPGATVQVIVSWALTEAIHGVYDWTAADAVMEPLRGWPVVVSIHRTPTWAREMLDLAGSRVKRECLTDLYAFAAAVWARYRPRALEPWIEPDATPAIGAEQAAYYGCWGDAADMRGAGRYYGEIFNGVRERLGAGVNLRGPATATAGEFLRGALEVCAPDTITFHQYMHRGQAYNPAGIWGQAERLSQEYGKPVCISETAYLAHGATVPAGFRAAQAAYWRALAEFRPRGCSWLWFALTGAGWEWCDLVVGGERTEAFEAYAATEINTDGNE